MKILYTTTIGVTMGFFTSFIKELVEDGNIVDVAANELETMEKEVQNVLNGKQYTVPWVRSPLSIHNVRAIKILRNLVSSEQYDIVHCHTPIAAICTRIACKTLRKKGVKVIYTAHGFHFYKGAPLKNWLLFYPIEKYCSRFTDVLIAINKEDFRLAKNKMKAKDTIYVPGVGIDLQKFSGNMLSVGQKQAFRETLGVNAGDKMLLSVGELSHRKNHEIVIRALAQIEDTRLKYYIAGSGELDTYLTNLITKLGLEDRVFLLGQRTDISELCECTDLFVFPSFQEGLPVALMESIASRTPTICSNIRGNTDLVATDDLFDPHSVDSVKRKIEEAFFDPVKEKTEMNYANLQNYDISSVNKKMKQIYGGI